MRQRHRVVVPPVGLTRLQRRRHGDLTGGVLGCGDGDRNLARPCRDPVERDRRGSGLSPRLGGRRPGGRRPGRRCLGRRRLRGPRLDAVALGHVDGDVDGSGHLTLGLRLQDEVSAGTGRDAVGRGGQFGGDVTGADDVLGRVGLPFGLVGRHRRVLLEVVRPRLEVREARELERPLREGGEVVTAGGEEAQGRDAVVPVRIDLLTVDLDRLHALAAGRGRIVDDVELLRDAEVEERARGAVGLPLLLEEADDVGALHRHDAVVVGERQHRVEFGGRDLARLLVVVDVVALEIRAQSAGVRDAEVRGRELGVLDPVLEGVGDEVAERRFRPAVLRTVLGERARDVLGDRALDDGARTLRLLLGVGDDLLHLVDDRRGVVLVLGRQQIRTRCRPIARTVGFELDLPDVGAVVPRLENRPRALGVAGDGGVEVRCEVRMTGEEGVDGGIGLGDELLELRVRGLRGLEAVGGRGAEVGLDDRHVRLLILRQGLDLTDDAVDGVGRVAEVDVGDARRGDE